MIENLEPKAVWSIFEEITKVPRPSKHEELIRYFIEECGYDASDPYYLCGYCFGVDKYSYETFEYFLQPPLQ